MARIGKDHSSWKAGGVMRRDARAIRDNPNVRHPGKKDTHRWCKGKVGREHVIVSRPWHCFGETLQFDYREDVCVTCGKVMRFYRGS